MRNMRCCWLFIVGMVWMLNGRAMEYSAEMFGNKTKNLDILQNGLVADIAVSPGVTYHVQVPAFIGIAHADVQAYLATQWGESLTVKWQKICHETLWNHSSQEDVIADLLKTKKYPDAFLAAVEKLGNDLKKIFEEHVFNFFEIG